MSLHLYEFKGKERFPTCFFFLCVCVCQDIDGAKDVIYGPKCWSQILNWPTLFYPIWSSSKQNKTNKNMFPVFLAPKHSLYVVHLPTNVPTLN